MGLGDFLLKKTAKSTANSIAKYVNGGRFGTPNDALKAWASTRRNGALLVMMVDDLARGIPHLNLKVKTDDIARSLFYTEMDVNQNNLSESVRTDIEKIFTDALN